MPDLPFVDWARLIEAPKALFSWPDWQTPLVYQESRQAAARAGRSRFTSHDAERCRIHAQIMDSTGASIEGVEILILMWRHRPLEDMTALFNVTHEGKAMCISRVDANTPCAADDEASSRLLDEFADHHHRGQETVIAEMERRGPSNGLDRAMRLKLLTAWYAGCEDWAAVARLASEAAKTG